MKLPISILLVVVVLAPGCLVDTGVEGDLQLVCVADGECPEGRACVEGFCLTPEQIAVPPVAFDAAPAFVGAGTDDDESVRSNQPGKSAFHVTFTLNQKLPVDRVSATFDGEALACDDVAAPLYSCAGDVNNGTPAGVRPVTIVARDAIGREAEGSALLTIDKEAPVPAVLDVTIKRDGLSFPVAGGGAQITVTIAFDEAPVNVEVSANAPGNEAFVVETDDRFVTALLDIAAGSVNEGARGLRIVSTDRVDNEAATEVADVFTVDTTAPAPPDVDGVGVVVHERAPWGSLDGPPLQRVVGADSGAEAEATVEVSVSEDPFQPLVVAAVAAAGDFSATLPIPDVTRVFVRTVDDAGNASAVVHVKDGVFSMVSRQPAGTPANPLNFDATPSLDDELVNGDMLAIDGPGLIGGSDDTVAFEIASRGRWRQRAFTAPPPARTDAPLAHDAARDEVVLFGGLAGATLLDDTWVFDGERWDPRSPERSPPARRGHAAAYDAAGDAVVLFGGEGADGLLDDTWLWDGQTWEPVAAVGPSARQGAAMARSPDGGVVLVGGDTAGGPSDEVWRFEARTRTWTSLPSGPPARSGAAASFDGTVGREIVIFGGEDLSGPLDDTWALRGTTWVEIQTTPALTPAAQAGAALAWDVGSSRLVLVASDAGFTDTRLFTFDGAEWQPLVSPSAPPVRRAAGFVSSARGAVLFGGTGLGAQLLGDAFLLDGDFKAIVDDTPPAFLGSATEYDAANERVILVGAAPTRRTWAFDGAAWRELFVDGGVVGALAVNAAGEIVQVGAASNIEVLGLLGWAARGVTSVLALGGGTAAAFDGESIVAVGATDVGFLDESTGGWVAAADPGARAGAALSFAGDSGAVLVGGSGGCGARCDDTWVWDGVTWSEALGAGPPARADHALAYDAARDEVVLFGGAGDAGALGDTWAFRGGAWRELPPATAPSARTNPSMTWDDSRRRISLFGGVVGVAATNESWEWRGGGDDHAALVVRAPFSAAGVVAAATPSVDVAVRAGARGRPLDVNEDGFVVRVWGSVDAAWSAGLGPTEAPPDAPADFSSTFAATESLIGPEQTLHLAITPSAPSGIVAPGTPSPELVVDGVSVTFQYRLP